MEVYLNEEESGHRLMQQASALTLDLLATTGFGNNTYGFLGKQCTKSKPFSRTGGTLAPVVGGLLVALILSYLKITGLFAGSMDLYARQPSDESVFTCVGFGFSLAPHWALEKKFCAGIALSVLLLVLLLHWGLLECFWPRYKACILCLIQIGTGARREAWEPSAFEDAYGEIWESLKDLDLPRGPFFRPFSQVPTVQHASLPR